MQEDQDEEYGEWNPAVRDNREIEIVP
jgi:hypothetical protein